MNTKKKIKKYISHHLGLRPFLENISDDEKKKFIPNGYQAVITISADFELAWAWQHAKNTDIKTAKKQAQIARDNIPLILDLCDKYNFPITWFTVGHLFLDNCKKENGIKHPEIKRLPHFEISFFLNCSLPDTFCSIYMTGKSTGKNTSIHTRTTVKFILFHIRGSITMRPAKRTLIMIK